MILLILSDDLTYYNEWIVEKNEAKLSFGASHEGILVKVGEDEDASRGGGGAPIDDLRFLQLLVMMKVMEEVTLIKMRTIRIKTVVIMHLI